MTTNEKIQWKRISVEAVAIVASILMAFAIDAWWDQFQNADREQALIRELLDEFEEIESNVEALYTYQRAIQDGAYRLVRLSAADDPEVSDAEIDQELEDQLWISSPERFSATKLNSMIARGDLQLISNDELSAKLSSWPNKFYWVQRVMQADFDFHENHLLPYLYRNTDILQITESDNRRPGTPDIVMPNHPVTNMSSVSHRHILDDRLFKNLMLQRASIIEDIFAFGSTSKMPEEVADTIRLLQEELE